MPNTERNGPADRLKSSCKSLLNFLLPETLSVDDTTKTAVLRAGIVGTDLQEVWYMAKGYNVRYEGDEPYRAGNYIYING